MQPATLLIRDPLGDGLRAGDRAVFSALVREHQQRLYFHCLRMVRGDAQLARDLVQRAFLAAWSKRADFRGEAAVSTWLLRIATNLSLNELQRAHRRRETVLVDDEGAPAELGAVPSLAFERLEDDRQRAALRSAIETLPPRQKAVVLLRLYEELTFPEIGDVLEITANNARVHFHHATRAIKARLSRSAA